MVFNFEKIEDSRTNDIPKIFPILIQFMKRQILEEGQSTTQYEDIINWFLLILPDFLKEYKMLKSLEILSTSNIFELKKKKTFKKERYIDAKFSEAKVKIILLFSCRKSIYIKFHNRLYYVNTYDL